MQVQVHHTLISTSDLEATLGFRKNMVGSRVVLLQHADFAKTVKVRWFPQYLAWSEDAVSC